MLLKLSADSCIKGLDTDLSLGLNELGVQSGISQSLTGPITSCEKLAASISAGNIPNQQHHLYIYKDEGSNQPLGFIKWGIKDLFFYRKNGSMLQCSPICLLDFFVHETLQRRGVGFELFQAMLTDTATSRKERCCLFICSQITLLLQ